jgi:murein L,D-transpeptidase YafK
MILVGLKQEKQLELWVSDGFAEFRLLKTYPILAASGTAGPKLKEGDRQVPEGLYQIESLNPNSRFHLALRVNYPNDLDKEHGRLDGRSRLGGDIMIHGNAVSIGCLAMGDQAAEDLFVLAAETGVKNIAVILTPVDFRVRDLPSGSPPAPSWTAELYAEIRKALAPLKH